LPVPAVLWFLSDLPRPEDALDDVRRPSLVLQDSKGATIATYGDVVGDAQRHGRQTPGQAIPPDREHQELKVFCFFSSEKKNLLS
jgi:hypothetical protein